MKKLLPILVVILVAAVGTSAYALTNESAPAKPASDEFDGGKALDIATTTQNLSGQWNLDRIDQNNLPLDNKFNYAENGTGVTIYHIDSGVRHSHADLAGKLLPGVSFVGGKQSADFDDCHGHGTHTAATLVGNTYGVAKGAKLVPVHVLACDSMDASWKGTIAGVNWVTNTWNPASGPAIMSMSVGGSANATLDAAIQKAITKGITVVIGAGNDNRDACVASPARVKSAITVGATTNNDTRASYSNWGSCVDLFAPGSSIRSAGSTGDTAISIRSGTSMATPVVAGLAAQLLQTNKSATPAQVQSAIVAQTSKVVTDSKGYNGLAQTGGTITAIPVATMTSTTVKPTTTTTVKPTTTTTVKPTTTTTAKPTTTTTAAPKLKAGQYIMRGKVYDRNGKFLYNV